MKNKIPESSLPRWQKLLMVLFDLSSKASPTIKFEDIVVAAYKKYPETFHLRGYKEYPDSGDLIHKPLYDMRPRGYLIAKNKMFSLTEKGVRAAIQIKKLTTKGGEIYFKPSRDIKKEIEHILLSESFMFYKSGKKENILDTDFFQFLGVSVHSTKNEFKNRLEALDFAIKESKNYYPLTTHKSLIGYQKFLMSKFGGIIRQISNRKERDI